jgi:hypothetical protein
MERPLLTETKVAAYYRSSIKEQPKGQWIWEKKRQLGFTSESDLVAAVTYLRKQSRSSLRLSYISKLYLPIYLIRVNPNYGLIICGVGNTSITLKNITVLPPEAFENLLSHVERTQQVPSLVINLEKLVRNLHPTSVTIPKPMKPSMLDPIRRLVEPSLPHPSNKQCIKPPFDKADALAVETNVREELTRLSVCQEHIMHMMQTINKYIERQLNYINEERLKIHQSTAAELDMAQLLNQLEGILNIATQRCRQFILQMDSSPTKTDLIFREDPKELTHPRILAKDFRQSLQQTFTELDAASSKLDEVEQRWLSLFKQEAMGHQQDGLFDATPEYHSLVSPGKNVSEQVQSQLTILVSLRERILGSYPSLIQTLHDTSSKLEKQYNRFLAKSVKTDGFLGKHPFVEILIPIFVIKTHNPTRYAIIPPLKFQSPSSSVHWKGSKQVPPLKAFNIQLFDDHFCLTLQDHVRFEMITKAKFRESLDKLAMRNDELKHKKRVDRFLQGVQELSLQGLMSTNLADDLTQFWLQIK